MASSTIQRISSLYSGIMKLLPLPLLLVAVVFIIIGIGDHSLTLFPDGLILLVFTVALAFFAWHSYRLEFVAVDNDKLYGSGWFTHRAIPLSNVESIYYAAGITLVFVVLKSPSAFGRKFAFMPTVGSAFFGSVEIALGDR